MVGQRPQVANGLYWVRGEIEQSLGRARSALEQYLESPEETQHLEVAAEELHLVRGTVGMIQCFGAAALAEEMLQLLNELRGSAAASRNFEALSAVTGATLHLSDYVDMLVHGESDRAVVLQPVINELRLARGKPVLTEAALFASQLRALQEPAEEAPEDVQRGGAEAVQNVARRELTAFQAAFVRWFRGQNPDAAMARMARIADAIAVNAGHQELRELWSNYAVLADCLRGELQYDSLELKRLFGRAGTLLKRLVDEGEAAAGAAVGDTAQQLIFHIARTGRQTDRSRALLSQRRIDELLPAVELLEDLRRRLRGPNTTILSRVHTEIARDFAQVKDGIDLAVRTGGRSTGDLATTAERLLRLSKTLGALGLAAPQQALINQAGALQKPPRGAQGWMEVATAILRVEHSLEEALFGALGRRGSEPARPYAVIEAEVPNAQDLRESTRALLRESLVDLAHLKAAVDAYLKNGDASAFEDAPRMLNEVAAGLLMLNHPRACALVRQLEAYTRLGTLVTAQTGHAEFERFADAISSVEVYLEALRDGLPQPGRILEDLEHYIQRLNFRPPAAETEAAAAVAAAVEAVEPPPAPAPAAATMEIDPEIRDIFIEEAQDVLAELKRQLPAFKRDHGDRGVLAEVRRAFHTLKGSGRMVGALRIGEFGWALENMLNRCLEGALAVRAPVQEVVQQAVALLPALIESFRLGDTTAGADAQVVDLIDKAVALASTRGSSEPEMLAVFRDDARERLALVRRWLEAKDPRASQFEIDADVIRAFHTLRGSAAVINAEGVRQVAAAFENLFNTLRLEGRELPASALPLIADVVVTLRNWVESADVVDLGAGEVPAWQARINALLAAEAGAAPAAPLRPAVDQAFCLEALNLLQAAEQQARDWASQPESNRGGAAAENLSGALAGLADRADRAGCGPLAGIGSALSARLAEWRGGQAPGAGFFTELLELLEGLYQQLDAYRDGEAAGDSSGWLARVQVLPLPPPVVAAPPVVQAAPVVAPVIDEELLEVFGAEAEELLGSMVHYVEAWQRDPGSPVAMQGLRRALHTLKGSARTTQVDAIGNVAHRLESLVADDVHVQPAILGKLLGVGIEQLQHLVDDLRSRLPVNADRALAAIEAAVAEAAPGALPPPPEPLAPPPEPVVFFTLPEPPPAAEMLEPELPVAAAPPAVPELPAALELPLTLELPVTVEPPATVELPVMVELPVAVEPPAAPEPPPAPEPLPEPRPAGVAAVHRLDQDITDIFSAEATELLEQLDSGFEGWQNGDVEAVRDVQRALHTLKGGARMAGLDAMADVTHDLETEVNGLTAAGEFPEPVAFERMRSALERLQGMHDQVLRGEAELLVNAPVAAEAPPAEVPAAAPAPIQMPMSVPAAAAVAAPPPVALPAAAGTATQWSPELFWRPEEEISGFALARRETARVQVDLLDSMLNQAGEISIYRSRLEERNNSLRSQLSEMSHTVIRIREQLRMLDIETEAQIAARGMGVAQSSADRYAHEFDPLEMDRYSRMQELSRTLAESISDLSSLQTTMDEAVGEADALFLQQSRVTSELQQGLMGTLMVPFSRQVQRLLRVVRQTALENGKQVDAQFHGVEAELDRHVLERITAPLEHLLRNAVVHGIEDPAERALAGKPMVGTVHVRLSREGAQLLVELSDDGRGLDYAAIRNKAIERGLMAAGAQLSDDDLGRFIFEPGFSTAKRLTQDAGRGIGMDVVASEVKQLAGTLELRSESGKGTRFQLRLPLTLAVSQALLVGVGQDSYAIPLPSIEGIARLPRAELADYLRDDGPLYAYGGRGYRVRYLGDFVGVQHELDADARTHTAILVRLGEGLGAAERRVALIVDTLFGNREIVSKSVGPQVSSVPGVAGATILADGRVVLILDVAALVTERARRAMLAGAAGYGAATAEAERDRNTIMVVDDSITMRRVAERLLTRNGYRVVTAKDGLDAIAMLQTETPAAVLLDIEMPRADGFEVAAFIRNSPRLAKVPIIMITSRSGEKHRERARSLGVDRYLIKPYQEDQLLAEVKNVCQRPAGVAV